MNKTCEGLPIYSPEEFFYEPKEAYVLLAVADDAVKIMAKVILLTKGMEEEHVRLYGRDFKERLELYGLSVKVKVPEQELSHAEIKKYGFIQNDKVLLCKHTC